MSRMALTYFLLMLFGFAVLSRVVHGDTGNNGVCDQWTDLAHKVSGSGKTHNCTTRAKDCTVMDCLGATTFSRNQIPVFVEKDIFIRYCFGMQINSCKDPISMDFYLQVPERNVSTAYRVFNDEEYPVKELNYSLGSLGSAYPIFNIVFERNNNSSINISVTGEVKVYIDYIGTPISTYKFYLIDDMVIPVKPCDKIVKDDSKTPPTSFVPTKCQLKSEVPINTVNTSTNEKPSETLNKTCSLEQMICGQREMCDGQYDPPRCSCKPEFKKSEKGDVCLSLSKLNQTCVQSADCDHNQECRAGSSNTLTCQCLKRYKYNSSSGMCTESVDVLSTQVPVTTRKAVTSHTTPSQSSNSTIKGAGNSEAGSSSGKHLPIFIGGGAAATVVVGLLLFGTIRIIRRRRRPHLSISDRESSSPLIGNSDSDNLIM